MLFIGPWVSNDLEMSCNEVVSRGSCGANITIASGVFGFARINVGLFQKNSYVTKTIWL